MNKKNLEYWLIGFILISGFFAFFSINRAIKIPDSSTWIVPLILVSIYVISFLLMSIFARYTIEVEIVVLLSLLMNLFFVAQFWHLVILVVFSFLILSALDDIRRDLDLNVKISLWKSLYTGKFKIIFSLAIIICSQYFFTIKNLNGQVKMPRIDLSPIVTRIAKPVFSEFNPSYKNLANENLTVDQYILQAQGKPQEVDLSQDNDYIDSLIPKDLPATEQESIKNQVIQRRVQAQTQLSQKNQELILKEGRNQLSKALGQQLNGDEKIADVIVGPVGSSVNRYFQLNVNGNSQSSLFPYILSIVLFFTLWSLGSLFSVFWFLVVMMVYKIFLRLKWIQIERVSVERERII